MRQLTAIVTVLLIVALAANAWATGGGREGNDAGNKSGGSGRLERQVQIDTKFITIKATDSRRFGIDWIAIGDGQTMAFTDVSDGFKVEDQDRVDLSFIPFINQVVTQRYTGDDVSPRNRIGSAWALNNILFVALNGGEVNIFSALDVIVLNQKLAFVMKAPPLPIDWPSNSELSGIGELPPFRDFAMPNAASAEVRNVLVDGLDTPAKVEAASRLPMLGDIPTLGGLFVGSAHRGEDNKLIVHIRPSIITPSE